MKTSSDLHQRKKQELTARNIVAMLYCRARASERTMNRVLLSREGKEGKDLELHEMYLAICTSDWAAKRNSAIVARQMLAN